MSLSNAICRYVTSQESHPLGTNVDAFPTPILSCFYLANLPLFLSTGYKKRWPPLTENMTSEQAIIPQDIKMNPKENCIIIIIIIIIITIVTAIHI
jgi:hypothetical protein